MDYLHTCNYAQYTNMDTRSKRIEWAGTVGQKIAESEIFNGNMKAISGLVPQLLDCMPVKPQATNQMVGDHPRQGISHWHTILLRCIATLANTWHLLTQTPSKHVEMHACKHADFNVYSRYKICMFKKAEYCDKDIGRLFNVSTIHLRNVHSFSSLLHLSRIFAHPACACFVLHIWRSNHIQLSPNSRTLKYLVIVKDCERLCAAVLLPEDECGLRRGASARDWALQCHYLLVSSVANTQANGLVQAAMLQFRFILRDVILGLERSCQDSQWKHMRENPYRGKSWVIRCRQSCFRGYVSWGNTEKFSFYNYSIVPEY